MDRVRDLAAKKAEVIFTTSSCCMCHSIKQLFYELGPSPAIHKLDKDPSDREMELALRRLRRLDKSEHIGILLVGQPGTKHLITVSTFLRNFLQEHIIQNLINSTGLRHK